MIVGTVIEALEAQGVEVVSQEVIKGTLSAFDDVAISLKLSDTVTLKVGATYLSLSEFIDKNNFTCFECVESVDEIITQLKEVSLN